MNKLKDTDIIVLRTMKDLKDTKGYRLMYAGFICDRAEVMFPGLVPPARTIGNICKKLEKQGLTEVCAGMYGITPKGEEACAASSLGA